MKKIIIAVLIFVAVIGAFSVGAAAYLGESGEVMSSDVKIIKTALKGKKICFSDADVKSALALVDFEKITVVELPSSTEGTLLLSGRRVGEGKSIKRKDIPALVFIPASADVEEAHFKISIDGYAGGAVIECVLKFIDKVNYAPSADTRDEECFLKTQESIALHGKMAGTDPEGDEIEYIVVSYPENGYLRVQSGSADYVYTPISGYVGEDKFVYVVRDEYGNYSEPHSVRITVNKRMSGVEYADMTDSPDYNAAVAMTAMGIMDGRLIGDARYFMPSESVSRAEFVAMAMKSVGIRADSTLSESFFDDNDEIPTALVGYVATAQKIGYINGDFSDGQLVFRPNDPITKYEAAAIMAALLGEVGDGEESVFADDTDVPTWARAGVYAMRMLGVFDEEEGDLSTAVTRADAASYLYSIAQIN